MEELKGGKWELEYAVRAKGPALGPIRSFSADRREKKEDRVRKKYPTKLVKAAIYWLLSPHITTMDWILKGK